MASESLRAELSGAYDLVALVDPNGLIQRIDGDSTPLFGIPADQLVGTSALVYVHPDEQLDAAGALRANAERSLGRGPSARFRFRHADGTYRSVELLALHTIERLGGYTIGLRRLSDTDVRPRAAEEPFRRLAALAADAMLLVDPDGSVVLASSVVEQVLGLVPDELVGQSATGLFSPSDRFVVADAVRRASAIPGAPVHAEVRVVRHDGANHWVDLSVVDLVGDPLVGALVLQLRDVHDRRLAEEQLRYLAMHDPLTGLANRLSFVEHLGRTSEPTQQGLHTALIFCDLDNFKQVNDVNGHSAGDEVLRITGIRLRSAVRPDDLVARIGGDEFCVVCRNLATEFEAREIAERIRSTVVEPVSVTGPSGLTDVSIGVSIGIAWTDGGVNGDELLGVADRAMYAAKTGGRNRVEVRFVA